MYQQPSVSKIELFGRVPSKKNSRISTRSGRSFPSKAYTQWHKGALDQLIAQGLTEERIDYPIKMTVSWWSPDRRKYDLSNKFESLADLLVDYGYLLDDNFTIIADVRNIYEGVDENKEGCVKVDIEAI